MCVYVIEREVEMIQHKLRERLTVMTGILEGYNIQE